jgi:hypothetical protein
MVTHPQDRDWKSIAEQVSVEMDPVKFAILVEQLCGALEGGEKAALRSTDQNRRGLARSASA